LSVFERDRLSTDSTRSSLELVPEHLLRDISENSLLSFSISERQDSASSVPLPSNTAHEVKTQDRRRAAADVTSAAAARLLGDSLIHDSDGDLDTTLPNVVLDPDDLMLLDVRLCDLESDGENGDFVDDVFDHISPTKLTDANDEDFKPAGICWNAMRKTRGRKQIIQGGRGRLV